MALRRRVAGFPRPGPDRRLNVSFLSGAQIDGQGNLNLMAVGPYQKPQVRLPGGAGSAILAYVVERVVLFKTRHEARGLVPKVDLVTAPGYTPELSPWQRPGRLTRLITPRCVFALTPRSRPYWRVCIRGRAWRKYGSSPASSSGLPDRRPPPRP